MAIVDEGGGNYSVSQNNKGKISHELFCRYDMLQG